MLGQILFGRRGSEFFEINFDYIHPKVEGTSESRITSSVIFSIGFFRGNFPVDLFTYEIRQLLTDLQVLRDTMSGSARFCTLEGQVEFSATLQATGAMMVAGELRDNRGLDNRLLFEMDLDQTYLSSPIASLKRFVSEQL